MTRRLRLVIADDEDDIRNCFGRLLEKLGYDVVADAADGCELVQRCRELDPDLVITDVQMPLMTGIEAAQELNKTHAIPVIVLSSFERFTDENPNGRQCDAVTDYLLKPVSVPDLQQAIARACNL